MPDLKVYGAPWCPDCKRSKKFLADHRIPMEWIDIDQDHDGLRVVEKLQGAQRSGLQRCGPHSREAAPHFAGPPNHQ